MKNLFILMVIISSNFYGQEKKSKFEFDTSYHQFYISDKNSSESTGAQELWTEKALVNRLATGNRLIGIWTASYGPIKGEITVLDTPPKRRDFFKYDHVVEAAINIDSGILQILDSPNLLVEKEIIVHPGSYRIRVYSSNLNIQDEEEGGDYYAIEIWSSDKTEKEILKMFK